MSELFVVRERRTGLYNMTGLTGTPDLQHAVIYSARNREGTRRLDHFRGRSAKYQVIPVEIVRKGHWTDLPSAAEVARQCDMDAADVQVVLHALERMGHV